MAMCAVALLNAILENIPGCEQGILPGVIELYLGELGQKGLSQDVKMMLSQGLLLCMWYSHEATLGVLASSQNGDFLEPVFSMIWEGVQAIKHDFEVKKFMLGLGKLVSTTPLPDYVNGQMENVMKCLCHLSRRSVEIRLEADQSAERPEQAEVHHEGGAIVEDEDEDEVESLHSEDCSDDDWSDGDDGSHGEDLYASPLDQIDEVLFFRDQITKLQQQNP
jgi:hypothetical protein